MFVPVFRVTVLLASMTVLLLAWMAAPTPSFSAVLQTRKGQHKQRQQQVSTHTISCTTAGMFAGQPAPHMLDSHRV
jgi:hypothetical protein